MTATIHDLPVKTPAPRWDADDAIAIKHAEFLHRLGVTAGEAFGVAARHPDYLPVAEALERVAETGRDMIRAASRR